MSIRELARHLNVSIGTVSRALNGKTDVSDETRRRVLAAADELGYSPNQSGRSLRQGVTGMIALILPANGKMALADTIFMEVLEGLRAFLDGRNLDLMVLLSGPEENAYAYLRRVAARRLADGLIIAETQRSDPRIDYMIEKDIPFVAFGRSELGSGYPWVDLNFEQVAEDAVGHLASLGHERIAVGTAASEINYSYVFAAAFQTRCGAAAYPSIRVWCSGSRTATTVATNSATASSPCGDRRPRWCWSTSSCRSASTGTCGKGDWRPAATSPSSASRRSRTAGS